MGWWWGQGLNYLVFYVLGIGPPVVNWLLLLLSLYRPCLFSIFIIVDGTALDSFNCALSEACRIGRSVSTHKGSSCFDRVRMSSHHILVLNQRGQQQKPKQSENKEKSILQRSPNMWLFVVKIKYFCLLTISNFFKIHMFF